MKNEVASPCVNICVLGLDNICAGCFRSLDEISAWSFADNEERLQIVNSARAREIDDEQ